MVKRVRAALVAVSVLGVSLTLADNTYVSVTAAKRDRNQVEREGSGIAERTQTERCGVTVSVRNNNKERCAYTISWFFVAESVGGKDRRISDWGSNELALDPGEEKSLTKQSEAVTRRESEDRYDGDRSQQGERVDGWLVTVCRGNETIEVVSSKRSRQYEEKVMGMAAKLRRPEPAGGAKAEARGGTRTKAPASAAERSALTALAAVRYESRTGRDRNSPEEFVYAEPMVILNELNQVLLPYATHVQVESRSRPVEVTDSHFTPGDGGELRSTAFKARGFSFRGLSGSQPDQIAQMDGRHVLHVLCALHGLGWKDGGDTLTLVDSDDATGPNAVAMVDAGDLADQAEKSQLALLKAYRGRNLLVRGLVSGFGKGTAPYVRLAGGRARVQIDAKVAGAAMSTVEGAYDGLQARAEERDVVAGPYRGPTLALLFVAEAKFDGITAGRIAFVGCREFTVMKTGCDTAK